MTQTLYKDGRLQTTSSLCILSISHLYQKILHSKNDLEISTRSKIEGVTME